jgi:hypothetical protein
METTLYPKWYHDARNNFESDIAAIKRDHSGISYSIFYGQWTDSATLDITSDLPVQVKIEIKESFKRNFRSF